MTVDVLSNVVMKNARASVAAYAPDPDHGPNWYVNIKGVDWKTPRPVRVGSRIAFVAQVLRRLASTYEVAEFAPGERLVMWTVDGPFPWKQRLCG